MPAATPDGDLARLVRSGSCLTVLGSGVTQAATSNAPCANWDGLLRAGVQFCETNTLELDGSRGLDRLRADLEAGDFLSAADKLQRALARSGRLAEFMHATVGELRANRTELLRAVQGLRLPAVTTNYDTLFASHAGRHAITWLDRDSLAQALETQALEEPRFVLHIHGVWTRLDSIVLGSLNYGHVGADEWVRVVDSAMGVSKHMLFVGCGRTVLDPHFSSLFAKLRSLGGGLQGRHYWLLPQSEAEEEYVQAACASAPALKTEIYGESYADLPDYLWNLARAGGRIQLSGRTDGRLLDVPLLPGRFSERLRLRNVYPRLLVEPVVESRSLFGAQVGLWEWFTSRPLGGRIVITGAAGAGKSTALRALALRPENQSRLVRASEDLQTFMGDEMVFVDGLDEVSHERRVEVVAWADGHDGEVWLGCRRDLFDQDALLADGSYDDVLTIQPFTLDNARHMAHELAALIQLSQLGEEFDQLLLDEGVREMVRNPLSLVILVFLLAERARGLVHDMDTDTRYGLYSSFYDYVIEYELDPSRGRAAVARAAAESVHAEAALGFYETADGIYELQVDDQVLLGAGLLVNTTGTARDLKITGFVHETFRAFIAARTLIQSVAERNSSAVIRSLGIAYNDDVNSFIREGFSSLDSGTRQAIGDYLTSRYALGGAAMREHLVYYLGRLDLEECPALLREIFDTPSPDALLRRSAALGAVLHGDERIEAEFLTEICSENSKRIHNLAVQRVYFGDTPGDIHGASVGNGPWSKARQALLSRLNERSRRATRLRWWDLMTLLDFYELNNESPLPEELPAIREGLERAPHRPGAVFESIGVRVRSVGGLNA